MPLTCALSANQLQLQASTIASQLVSLDCALRGAAYPSLAMQRLIVYLCAPAYMGAPIAIGWVLLGLYLQR